MSRNEIKLSSNRIKSDEEKVSFPQEKKTTPEKSNKNTLKMQLLILLIAGIVIAIIIVLCVLLVKKKEKEKEEETNIENTENTDTHIIALYNSKKGVPLKVFNPSRMGLNEQNYTIEDMHSNNARRLKQIKANNGFIIPETTGTIQIKISFNENLTNLDFMFEGCTDLIKVILSYLNSPFISSMIYTFTDCTNLETVDFTSFNSSQVKNMDFLFGGCTKLVNIKGLENLETFSLTKTAGMFLECANLVSVNLS